MRYWQTADTLIMRNIARSDGTVTTAIPMIVICDNAELLAVYIPHGTCFKNNWVVPSAQWEKAVDTIIPYYALDVIAYPNGQWHWKDEAEFARRREVGIDSVEHQVHVRAAGWELIARFERGAWPFNAGWQQWQAPIDWQVRQLPPNWAVDLGSHALL